MVDHVHLWLNRNANLGDMRNRLGTENVAGNRSEWHHSIAAFGLLLKLRYFEDCRRLCVGNVAQHYPAGWLRGIWPAKVHGTSGALRQGHCAGEEDNNVVNVVRLRNVQQELGLADLLKIGLNLCRESERNGDKIILSLNLNSTGLTNLPETMQPNIM